MRDIAFERMINSWMCPTLLKEKKYETDKRIFGNSKAVCET